MNGATDSELQLFKNLANPQRVDMNKERPPPFQPNMMAAIKETDFVSETSSTGSRKRKRASSPPPSYVQEEVPKHDEEDTRSAYSQTKSGRAEKVGFLLELKKLRMQGCHLTREYSTKDKLEDIKYEYERQKMNLDCINSVALMSDGLKLGLSGIEMANNKLGPFLSLHGWSESVTQDMSRFNHVLERIYRRYWRQGSLNPMMELGMILVGSMTMFHFQNKFLGPQPARKPTSNTNTQVPIDRNINRVKRPTMRGPNQSNLFGNMDPPPNNNNNNNLFGNMNPAMPSDNNNESRPTDPPPPIFSNIQRTSPEIREVEERGPPARRRNDALDVERVEEAQDEIPAYEEEDMKIGQALDIDL